MAPVLTSLTPSHGSDLGGEAVVLCGGNLTYTDAVTCGVLASFAAISDTRSSRPGGRKFGGRESHGSGSDQRQQHHPTRSSGRHFDPRPLHRFHQCLGHPYGRRPGAGGLSWRRMSRC
ncbi:hypothetical protein GCM10010502_65730 [Kitasatospora aureofaciens]|uniref:Uncharacterized protein n=1 Tax=Kitasatospora aureofaciens TaxID=1894 RepID=A0A8H9LYN4_KITAU|nr:hypothetical protein GCM10010502_65730 [Kitasatospora aureofaciens]